MASKLPYYPFYPSDCDTDERVRAMDDTEFGFYVRCLNHAWINGSLPSDLDELARVMGRDPESVKRVWRRVGQCFVSHPSDPGRLVNPRQEEEREKAMRRRTAARQNSMRRWQDKTSRSRCSNNGDNQSLKLAIAGQGSDGVAVDSCCDYDRGVATTRAVVSEQLMRAFHELVDRYPNATNVNLASQIWVSHCDRGEITEENVHEVFDGLARWLDSDQWARDDGRYIPSLARWLADLAWRDRPKLSAEARERQEAPEYWVAPWRTPDGRIKPEYVRKNNDGDGDSG